MNVRYGEQIRAINLDFNGALQGFVSNEVRAKNCDGADRDIAVWNWIRNKEGILVWHVAKFLKAIRGRFRLTIKHAILIYVVIVAAAKMGTTRTFWIFCINRAVSDVNFPLRGVEIAEVWGSPPCNIIISLVLNQKNWVLSDHSAMVKTYDIWACKSTSSNLIAWIVVR